MFQSFQTLQKLTEEKLTAVVRGDTYDEAKTIAEHCIEGGVKSIEVTFTTPNAAQLMSELKEKYKEEVVIGAGSVLDAETARIAILNGAEYVVSPCFDKGAAKMCNRYQIPYIPGCMTIKEIKEATEYGVALIKLFPGNNFSPSIIKAIKGPLPTVEVMPTGGVNLENVHEWLENGAAAVGVGSDWNKALKAEGAEGIVSAAKKYIEKLSQ
ncbi:bifunctional 2-keto-4-hydroxyglutarate aldolase/2-keto-3-deoxy-6-phosphogluconate aldolase [Bacillus shivajii]|uniref:bifunctional 2-keto-4-hydroxyglutarate aldolase/2-keto-3-deoxy-6-phosphogluconate aldolase n=1 Tax=Bacillus shivajii TaxID=1983719 RepID=UPI001CFA8F70|nr:bifunctional 2-keto-4-hydroxyglutarate aldolase/2-keto-3-deoxy-6-phosphogluconate aldolase [Bacillus shivajii]UCZ53866.1 bifunctional 2-keto-4-hydroxyglutarate aldolase/2-keto-3-deoxy-6-phosphogluconate aldolase [Bacillus shivajii]